MTLLSLQRYRADHSLHTMGHIYKIQLGKPLCTAIVLFITRSFVIKTIHDTIFVNCQKLSFERLSARQLTQQAS